MLRSLCGSKTIEQILLFLFVNGKCYGTQLHRLLQKPLTPLQKGLSRLEKTGVILSEFEGKTKIYRFNPSFALLAELEQLLKKGYTLLPLAEKTLYYAAKEEISLEDSLKKRAILSELWSVLSKVKSLTFSANTKSTEATGWEGQGSAEVLISKEGNDLLIFTEQGLFKGKESIQTRFTNVFRWSWNRQAHLLSLEHLRRGKDHPMLLVQLTPSGKHSLTSIDSLVCAKDTYFAQLRFDAENIRLSWRVIGPKKDEQIECYYSIYPHP